ncbi:unnamed protein product [Chondrus crispus]|uniref:Uncharacterized protein n=1 Tax=Chondrus crispus TaxID=2769 RepID=R7QFW4_CHOCR|nr:unnamed protein product [Chondrus crispus]CDF37412.1 unnamed protein product [Chondrus crispus]|eukprot:XP_005717231.1 unnamed protein product [Chondrus crispus]
MTEFCCLLYHSNCKECLLYQMDCTPRLLPHFPSPFCSSYSAYLHHVASLDVGLRPAVRRASDPSGAVRAAALGRAEEHLAHDPPSQAAPRAGRRDKVHHLCAVPSACGEPECAELCPPQDGRDGRRRVAFDAHQQHQVAQGARGTQHVFGGLCHHRRHDDLEAGASGR